MVRPPTLVTGFIAIPGWLAATAPPSAARLAAFAGAAVLARAVANILNDFLDESKDRTTAPELPLPAGLVTHRQAALAALALSACVVGLLGVAAQSPLPFLLGLCGLSAGGVLIGLYSLVKPHALTTLAVTACVYVCLPLSGWVVAGAGWSAELGIVLGYAALRGLAGNMFSSLRDVDSDPRVGNRSIAVRLGAARAFALGVAIELLATTAVVAVAVLRDRVALGVLVAAAIAACLLLSYRATARGQGGAAGRLERTKMLWPLDVGRHNTGIVLVQSPPVGIVTTAVTVVLLTRGASVYARRIAGGELKADLAAGAIAAR